MTSGTQFVDELNQKIITDFSNRRVAYNRESNFGQISEKQTEWELQIQSEQNELNQFANK